MKDRKMKMRETVMTHLIWLAHGLSGPGCRSLCRQSGLVQQIAGLHLWSGGWHDRQLYQPVNHKHEYDPRGNYGVNY